MVRGQICDMYMHKWSLFILSIRLWSRQYYTYLVDVDTKAQKLKNLHSITVSEWRANIMNLILAMFKIIIINTLP